MKAGSTTRIVLIEDDPALGEAVTQALRLARFDVTLFNDARNAIPELGPEFDGVVISDVRLPGLDGIKFFDLVRKVDRDIPVIFTTGHGDVQMAVDLLKKGAADFFTKPYAIAEVERAIALAAEKRSLLLENRRLRSALSNRDKTGIIGSSQAAETLRSVIAAVAEADIDAVFEGASGTGKTYCARMLHDLSPRASRAFVTIDQGLAAHRDAELILFGREPGVGLSRMGLIERASGGTLFLDDIAEMEGKVRSRLISTLDTRTILPMGAQRARKLDFRIIVATGGNAIASDDGLAPSLESRLGAVRISLPRLNTRREDIGEIFRRFVGELEGTTGRQAGPIGEAEWRHIQTHDWPGNLHELRAFARAFTFGLSSFGLAPAAEPTDRSLHLIVADFERSVLEEALKNAHGSAITAAKNLKIPRKTFYDKLSRYKLRSRDFR